ncbi:DUF6746 family protein [Thioalkalicoccus limnaeus]|uniref:DUF6746 family protein n=1 Tax=Thioalkalicoccus limnaeus TaxID=120681 RepID=A0ABV4BH15_9GAMM
MPGTLIARPLLLAALIAAAPMIQADERIEHFEGLPSETLEQALQNLSEYNRRLAAALDQGELTAADLAKIHELTYTLENALERIHADVGALAETLEEVHLASEADDRDTVITKGRAYLSTARVLVD